MDKKNFIEKIVALSQIYGREDLTEIQLDMYYITISSQLNDEEFNNAVNKILLNRKYGNFPTPAEFIEIVKGNQEQNNKIMLMDAEVKFNKILKSGRSIKCDDWAIHSTIKKMGGLDEIRKTENDKIKWLIKEFVEKYEAEKQRRHIGTEIPTILYTKRDKRNVENKMQILPPIFVGEEKEWGRWTAAITERRKKELKLENKVKNVYETN